MAGCPNDDVMAAFVEGRLDETEAASLHQHVDGCQSCQWLLKELAATGQATAPVVAPLFAPGAVLGGRYRLERRLGNGGMGTVWAAVHVGTNRAVALKILRPEKSGNEARLRFLREARVLGRVDHPNLVPVRDVFEEGGVPILAMDLLAGESLGERLRRQGTIPLPELSRLLTGAMEAVAFAHAAGIVHRDLKPDNLFISESGAMRVLDFGIAKLIEGDDLTLTGAGQVLGTPPYMAPEQLRGQAVDGRADVWAFGVILYECLSGKRPFTGERFAQIFDRVTSGTREPLPPGLPRDLVALVDKLLRVDVRERPADLKEAIAVLSRPRAPATNRRTWAPLLLLPLLAGVAVWKLRPVHHEITVVAPPSPSPSPVATPAPAPSEVMRQAANHYYCDGDEVCMLKVTPRISIIDCAHAVSADAKTICHDARLADLAGRMAAIYQIDREHYAREHKRLRRLPSGRYGIAGERGKLLPGTVPSPTAFSADQTAWLMARHRCGDDTSCLRDSFAERLQALDDIHRAFQGK